MRNIKYFVVLCAVCALPHALLAQVALDMQLTDGYHYLVNEPIYMRLLMRNDSGRPLVFGGSKQLRGKLRFELTRNNGSLIQPSGNEEPEFPPMVLGTGETSLDHFLVLNRYYRLTEPGTYRLHFWVSHPQMPQAYKSNEVSFNISTGIESWRVMVGEPDLLDSQKPVKTMYYTLIAVNKGARRMFFIRIEDDQRIYVQRPIGTEVGTEKIERDVDGLSNLHLIVPLDPKLFQYMIMDLKGHIEKTEVYKKRDKQSPRLGRDEKRGTVFVVGGEKAIPGVDFEEVKEVTKVDGTG
jgi:hypothetical protein